MMTISEKSWTILKNDIDYILDGILLGFNTSLYDEDIFYMTIEGDYRWK